MKNSLRCLAAWACLVFVPAAMAQPDSHTGNSFSSGLSTGRHASLSTGDRLLVEAASRLQRRRSVAARLRHQLAIRGERLYGVGSYWQQGSGDDLKVRWELQIAGQATRLLQISNSRFLWLDRALPTGRSITRIDLRQLRNDPVLASANIDDIRPGEASWSSAPSDMVGCFGGLPRLLASLGENFSFLPPQAMRLVEQEATTTGMPLFAVVGHWKPERLANVLEYQAPDNLARIPDRLPQEVLLLVDQTDLFPHRIEYRRLETPPAADPPGKPVPYQLSARPLLMIEFSDVAFDSPISAGVFDYAPPNVDWADHTAALLERLRRQRQEKMAAQSNVLQGTLPAR
jgi:hypothetical protein